MSTYRFGCDGLSLRLRAEFWAPSNLGSMQESDLRAETLGGAIWVMILFSLELLASKIGKFSGVIVTLFVDSI